MSILQGDHVSNVDPSDDESYHPISKIKNGTCAVLVGQRHQLINAVDLTPVTTVGSITYYRWTKPEVKTVQAPVINRHQVWKVDFRVDGWSKVKTIPAATSKKARTLAIAQLALEMNRTIPSLNAMIKRGDNRVIVTEVFN